MDGTLLTSEQQISEGSRLAISKAASAGKEVILCTGRSIAELQNYENIIPEVRYAICVSGAIVYDRKLKKVLFSDPVDRAYLEKAMELSALEDVMVQFLGEEIYLQKDQCMNANHYHMERLRALYSQIGVLVPDIRSYYSQNPRPIEKMNLYHTSVEARRRTRDRITEAGLSLSMKDAEITSLEITGQNVTKAKGLLWLCKCLAIDISETIAVGDAENDRDILLAAGLPIAMGNALPKIKDFVLNRGGKVVSDNDRDGCSEAILKYLLD